MKPRYKSNTKGKSDYSEVISNFRNNIIERAQSMSINEFLDYSAKINKKLEEVGSLENNQLRGELSEIVLEYLLKDLQLILDKFNIKSLVMKNLGMVNRSEYNDKLYSTEIDVCFATETRVYLFEVKSYSGDKEITKECYLEGKSSIDIYKQSKYHADIFIKLFNDCRFKFIKGREGLETPLKLIFFDFSSKLAIDKRNKEWKERIPYLTVGTFYNWFIEEITKDKENKVQWNLNKMLKRMEVLDKERETIMKYHVDRLKEGKKHEK